MKIAVIGLGYVGLPLALEFTRNGVHVVGIDTDPAKIERLKKGESYIRHIKGEDIRQATSSGYFLPTGDSAEVGAVEAVLICVPTPLSKNREPDLSYVIGTAEKIAPHLRAGMLVVLESTTYPGTTDNDLRKTLEAGSGLKAGEDFHLAFSPEREDPGNQNSHISKIPKVIGGFTATCLEKTRALYEKIVPVTVPVSSCRTAEATKLMENIFRSVNIALVNELKVVYAEMGIDIWEVVAAAKTKPFGYMPFYPGPGLGGHCIPIDPFYLTWKAREYGQHTRFIELAGEINTAMPDYVVGRVAEALNEEGKPIRNSRLLVLGLAYKPDVDDDRESPSYVIIEKLEARGARVDYHDPFIAEIGPTREHKNLAGRKSADISPDYDLILVCTAHKQFEDIDFSHYDIPIVDTRNSVRQRNKKYYQA